jgi:hypothetical protein
VEQELALQIMTNKSENCHNEEIIKELDNICEECKKEDESVSQNLILTSYKLCLSCRVSKTIFPI